MTDTNTTDNEVTVEIMNAPDDKDNVTYAVHERVPIPGINQTAVSSTLYTEDQENPTKVLDTKIFGWLKEGKVVHLMDPHNYRPRLEPLFEYFSKRKPRE